jgi:hypothetical protein
MFVTFGEAFISLQVSLDRDDDRDDVRRRGGRLGVSGNEKKNKSVI